MIESRSTVCLRAADAFDAAALAELRCAGLMEMGLLDASGGAVFVRRARRELFVALRDERAAAWLLAVDGRVEGCAYAVFYDRLPYPVTSLHAEIAGVYVRPAHRRNGYARELVREAIAAARARGARKIALHPTRQTRAFYAALGFAPSNQMRLA